MVTSPSAKFIARTAASGLRLVVSGGGETRGRRAHLLRLRESVVKDLLEVADGPMYMLVELALMDYVERLRAEPPGIRVISSEDLAPTQEDVTLLAQVEEIKEQADSKRHNESRRRKANKATPSLKWVKGGPDDGGDSDQQAAAG